MAFFEMEGYPAAIFMGEAPKLNLNGFPDVLYLAQVTGGRGRHYHGKIAKR